MIGVTVVYVVEVQPLVGDVPAAGIWELHTIHACEEDATAAAQSMSKTFVALGWNKPTRVREVTMMPAHLPFKPPWLVVIKRETDPPQVTPFNTEAEARAYESLHGAQWSESFVCKVVRGPRV